MYNDLPRDPKKWSLLTGGRCSEVTFDTQTVNGTFTLMVFSIKVQKSIFRKEGLYKIKFPPSLGKAQRFSVDDSELIFLLSRSMKPAKVSMSPTFYVQLYRAKIILALFCIFGFLLVFFGERKLTKILLMKCW